MKLHRIILIGLCMLVSSCSQAEQKEMKAKDLLKVLEKGKSLEIANVIILDDLDFTTLENEQMLSANQVQVVVPENVFFYNCIFMGKVTTSGTKAISSKEVQKQMKFEQNFVFQNCDFRGEVNFDNLIVKGQFSLEKSKFRQFASCNNMMIWSGTPFNAGDPLYKAVESGAWTVNVYPVCEMFPCEESEFRGSWPDRFDYRYVKQQYEKALLGGKIAMFNQELMLKIMSDEDRLIADGDIRYYSRAALLKNKSNYNFYITRRCIYNKFNKS